MRAVHFRERHGEPPVRALHDGGRHFQIACERGSLCSSWRLRLALRFQKQFRRGEDALAHLARALPPGCIELPGFAGSATMRGESGGHAIAIVQVNARHRHQILHRQLRCDLSFTDLLLDGFGQKFDQPQSP